MNTERLNEHDANLGAQSKGEFLGMKGNSAWFLLGAAGASIMIVIVLWGMLGLALLPCLVTGVVLCGLSLVYVFALKNNRPEHYDTDFFESTLVEAGLCELAFGPRARRPMNPFGLGSLDARPEEEVMPQGERVPSRGGRAVARFSGPAAIRLATPPAQGELAAKANRQDTEKSTVPIAAYRRLEGELKATEENLEEALAAHEEESPCE